jgi:hypothetical protein
MHSDENESALRTTITNFMKRKELSNEPIKCIKSINLIQYLCKVHIDFVSFYIFKSDGKLEKCMHAVTPISYLNETLALRRRSQAIKIMTWPYTSVT